MTGNPKQIGGLETNQVEDGFIIYCASTDRVHFLNNSAFFILELCNGRHAFAEILHIVSRAWSLAEVPESEIREHLEKLAHEGLIQYE